MLKEARSPHDIVSRLKSVIIEGSYLQKDIAAGSGLSPATISVMMNEPYYQHITTTKMNSIEAVCKYLQVSSQWLLTGEGQMMAAISPDTALHHSKVPFHITLLQLMEKKNLSQQQLSELCGVSQASISRILNGKLPQKLTTSTMRTLDRICTALGTTAVEVLCLNNENKKFQNERLNDLFYAILAHSYSDRLIDLLEVIVSLGKYELMALENAAESWMVLRDRNKNS